MKIMMIDKYYFVKGGAERYMFELASILEANGHEVIPFAMDHPSNFDSDYKEFFAPNIDYHVDSVAAKAATFFKASARMIYSTEARRRLERLIEQTQPDVAHLHMIEHQLSPSVLHALKRYGIPVVQTVHQYKLVCPNYRLYNPSTEKICEKCLTGHTLHPVKERCHKGSALAGLMVALESGLHRATGIYQKNIDLFHVPSHFMGQKIAQGGVGTDKIRHMFYTIEIQKFKPRFEAGDYLLYFGRLSDEKGILTLLRAAKAYPRAPLYLVGDGPHRSTLETYASENALSNVRFLGLKGGEELEALVRNARAIVVPSEWYENSPLVIYESFAYGKPVIGSKMGGIPELVDHEENGLLFDATDAPALAECMVSLWENPEKARQYGESARAKAEQEFDPYVHYQKIHEWYGQLMKLTPNLNPRAHELQKDPL